MELYRFKERCGPTLLRFHVLRAVGFFRPGVRYYEAEYHARPADYHACGGNPRVAAQKTRSYQLSSDENPHTKGVRIDVGFHLPF